LNLPLSAQQLSSTFAPAAAAAAAAHDDADLAMAALPAWVSSLVHGCTQSAHFEVAASCALTLAHTLSTMSAAPPSAPPGPPLGVVLGATTKSVPPLLLLSPPNTTPPPPMLPPGAIAAVFEAMWQFLGCADGRTQHTAAFVCASLLRLSPSIGAVVVAAQLRAAAHDDAVAHDDGASGCGAGSFLVAVEGDAHRACLRVVVGAPHTTLRTARHDARSARTRGRERRVGVGFWDGADARHDARGTFDGGLRNGLRKGKRGGGGSGAPDARYGALDV
jgi:hypothetical protein